MPECLFRVALKLGELAVALGVSAIGFKALCAMLQPQRGIDVSAPRDHILDCLRARTSLHTLRHAPTDTLTHSRHTRALTCV